MVIGRELVLKIGPACILHPQLTVKLRRLPQALPDVEPDQLERPEIPGPTDHGQGREPHQEDEQGGPGDRVPDGEPLAVEQRDDQPKAAELNGEEDQLHTPREVGNRRQQGHGERRDLHALREPQLAPVKEEGQGGQDAENRPEEREQRRSKEEYTRCAETYCSVCDFHR